MSTKKVKIAIFPPKSSRETVLGSNGISIDHICLKYNSKEECSTTGDYTLDAEFTVDNTLSDYVVDEAIIKCLIDDEYEIFRIVKNDKTTRRITVVAKQITITEQKQLWLDDVRPTNTTGIGGLSHMYSNAVGIKEIFIHSDISVVSTAYYQTIDFYKACFDCDQSFTNRWGANGLEAVRRGYHLYLNRKRGTQSNLSIIEGKNLLGFTSNTNIDTFVTRAVGKGFNGIKGHYIESSLKDKYARVNTKVIDYPNIKVKTSEYKKGDEGIWFDTEAEAIDELDRLVKLEFSKNHIDEIKATYNISFAQLEKTNKYKDYSYLEKAKVGDVVKVYIPSLEIDIRVRVVDKTFEGLSQKTKEMTLSNTATATVISTATIINNLKKQYEETGNNNISDYINAMINSGMQNSNVIIRENEILIMDTKDINTARNVWRWNAGGLAHSNEGYYSKNWNIGILQDGSINADIVRTGVLTAILIESLNGNTSIDLDTGKISFKCGGWIGNDECYWDLDKQIIKGNNLLIDLNEGKVEFNKGIINGLNSSWNLNTGVFESFGDSGFGPTSITIGNGSITSTDDLDVSIAETFFLQANTFWISKKGVGAAVSVFTDESIHLNRSTRVGGDLEVTGHINGVTNRIQALENIELQREGLI